MPELVAPAGDMERLKTALHFGADAVYLSAKQFTLRGFAKNFTIPEMEAAVRYAHGRNRRVYLAANSFLRNSDIKLFRAFLDNVSHMGFDAIILSDPGVLEPVHYSPGAAGFYWTSARAKQDSCEP